MGVMPLLSGHDVVASGGLARGVPELGRGLLDVLAADLRADGLR